ncbi:MAG: DUF2892 domain-containing protein [Hymenobacteraceae bacterium]|nr:DUF2892 domain-containing protein [Hymenobacteraceae bacterium]MDX5397479.1 DUF2892 domain-containing protein [Hymenobacteraceae bacterium]MDX5513555.1 DUF2892 domain-containing protein [Hymenobacteraceae bacterium]
MASDNTLLNEVLDKMHLPSMFNGLTNVGATERILSAAGGALLAYYGMQKKETPLGMAAAAAGGALLFRGVTGYCPVNQAIGRDSTHEAAEAIEIEETVVVDKPRQEVYEYWRNLENLPRFMKHLKEVTEQKGNRSHWVAKSPGNLAHVEWDAEILKDQEGTLIAWRSLPGADVENAGEVRFTHVTGQGTEVHVRISYSPPAGEVGSDVAKMLNPLFAKMIRDDIRSFKKLIESGKAEAENA